MSRDRREGWPLVAWVVLCFVVGAAMGAMFWFVLGVYVGAAQVAGGLP